MLYVLLVANFLFDNLLVDVASSKVLRYIVAVGFAS